MPATSKSQERLMQAAAHTKGGYGGVPQKVGKEFVGDLKQICDCLGKIVKAKMAKDAEQSRAPNGQFGYGAAAAKAETASERANNASKKAASSGSPNVHRRASLMHHAAVSSHSEARAAASAAELDGKVDYHREKMDSHNRTAGEHLKRAVE